MDKNKLILPISILLGCVILGGFYYASQINKQKSIERQQWIDLQAETTIEEEKIQAEKEKQNKIEQEETTRQTDIAYCLSNANDDYIEYLKLNGTIKKDGSIETPTYISDKANNNKQDAIDNCYKRFK